jgi:hypothetical protein
MHSGVFNVPHELRSAEVGVAESAFAAVVGHSSARKEMRRHPHEWPEKQPGVKKKQKYLRLEPHGVFVAEAGWPRGVAAPGLPQIQTCSH